MIAVGRSRGRSLSLGTGVQGRADFKVLGSNECVRFSDSSLCLDTVGRSHAVIGVVRLYRLEGFSGARNCFRNSGSLAGAIVLPERDPQVLVRCLERRTVIGTVHRRDDDFLCRGDAVDAWIFNGRLWIQFADSSLPEMVSPTSGQLDSQTCKNPNLSIFNFQGFRRRHCRGRSAEQEFSPVFQRDSSDRVGRSRAVRSDRYQARGGV